MPKKQNSEGRTTLQSLLAYDPEMLSGNGYSTDKARVTLLRYFILKNAKKHGRANYIFSCQIDKDN
jgi:hypothetical protein